MGGVVVVAVIAVLMAAVTVWELSTGVIYAQGWGLKRKYTRANNPVIYWSVVAARLFGLAATATFLVLFICRRI
jgi:hypothetical protein